MASENINLLGVLNSISVEQVIARANQIETNNYDGTKSKLQNILTSNVSLITAAELNTFINYVQTHNYKENRCFICINDNDIYVKGGIYLYNGEKSTLEKINLTEDGESNSDLYINAVIPENIVAEKDFDIFYSWNSIYKDYGKVIIQLDGVIVEEKHMLPGSGSYTMNLEIGQHRLAIYAIDSNGTISNRILKNITVSGFQLITSISDALYIPVLDTVDVAYKFRTDNINYNHELLVSLNNGRSVISHSYDVNYSPDYQSITLNRNNYTSGVYELTLKIKEYTLNNNEEENVSYSNEVKKILFFAETTTTSANTMIYTKAKQNTYNITNRDTLTIPVITYSFLGNDFVYTTSYAVQQEIGGIYNDYSGLNIPSANWTNGLNKFTISNLPIGRYRICLNCSGTLDNVEYSTLSAEEFIVTVTESLNETLNEVSTSKSNLSFSAIGRTNNDLDKSITNVEMTGFNFSTNGWIDNYLVLDEESNIYIASNKLATTPTISLVFKTTGTDDNTFLFSFTTNGPHICYDHIEFNNEIISLFEPNKLHEISLTYKNGILKIYLEGVLLRIIETTLNNPYVMIGNDISIKKLNVYDRALDDDEILQNYISNQESNVQDILVRDNNFKSYNNDNLQKVYLTFNENEFNNSIKAFQIYGRMVINENDNEITCQKIGDNYVIHMNNQTMILTDTDYSYRKNNIISEIVEGIYSRNILTGNISIHSEPVIVYLNNKYFGIYNLYSNNIGTSNSNIVCMYSGDSLIYGSDPENMYDKLLEWLNGESVTKEYFTKYFDIDSFLNYYIIKKIFNFNTNTIFASIGIGDSIYSENEMNYYWIPVFNYIDNGFDNRIVSQEIFLTKFSHLFSDELKHKYHYLRNENLLTINPDKITEKEYNDDINYKKIDRISLNDLIEGFNKNIAYFDDMFEYGEN